MSGPESLKNTQQTIYITPYTGQKPGLGQESNLENTNSIVANSNLSVENINPLGKGSKINVNRSSISANSIKLMLDDFIASAIHSVKSIPKKLSTLLGFSSHKLKSTHTEHQNLSPQITATPQKNLIYEAKKRELEETVKFLNENPNLPDNIKKSLIHDVQGGFFGFGEESDLNKNLKEKLLTIVSKCRGDTPEAKAIFEELKKGFVGCQANRAITIEQIYQKLINGEYKEKTKDIDAFNNLKLECLDKTIKSMYPDSTSSEQPSYKQFEHIKLGCLAELGKELKLCNASISNIAEKDEYRFKFELAEQRYPGEEKELFIETFKENLEKEQVAFVLKEADRLNAEENKGISYYTTGDVLKTLRGKTTQTALIDNLRTFSISKEFVSAREFIKMSYEVLPYNTLINLIEILNRGANYERAFPSLPENLDTKLKENLLTIVKKCEDNPSLSKDILKELSDGFQSSEATQASTIERIHTKLIQGHYEAKPMES